MVDVVIVYFPVLLSRCCSAAKYYCIVEFMRITNASTICTLHPVSLQLAAMGLVVAACGHGSGGCCLHPASSCPFYLLNILLQPYLLTCFLSEVSENFAQSLLVLKI